MEEKEYRTIIYTDLSKCKWEMSAEQLVIMKVVIWVALLCNILVLPSFHRNMLLPTSEAKLFQNNFTPSLPQKRNKKNRKTAKYENIYQSINMIKAERDGTWNKTFERRTWLGHHQLQQLKKLLNNTCPSSTLLSQWFCQMFPIKENRN